MAKTKDGRQDLYNRLVVLLARAALNAIAGRASLRREPERLLDGQRGEVHIVLGTVLHVAAEVFLDFGRREGMVMHLALDAVKFRPQVGEHLEETGASRSGPTEHDFDAVEKRWM